MDFTLAHGTANSFVVLPDLDGRYELSAEFARALAAKGSGFATDGVLRVAPGSSGAQVFMDHRNADGSLAEMCGNGIRVVAKYVLDRHLVTPPADGVVRIGTRAGIKSVTASIDEDGLVEKVMVDMGPPILTVTEIPFLATDPSATLHEVHLDSAETLELAVASMGNPHGVVRVEDVTTADVARLGPELERHDRFPEHANIGFAQVIDRDAIRLRVWERGVGETAACGTGACAAVVCLQRQGLLDEEVRVELPGGTLTVRHQQGQTVWMEGPAVEVASGRLEQAWLEGALPAETVAL